MEEETEISDDAFEPLDEPIDDDIAALGFEDDEDPDNHYH